MSKDEIIWSAWSNGHPAIWALLWIAAGVTVFYMFRQVYMTFFGDFRGTHEQAHHLHEPPPSMSIVLIVLGTLSVVGGVTMMPEFIAPSRPFEHFLDPVFSSPMTLQLKAGGLHDQRSEMMFAALSLLMVVGGWLLADLTYRRPILSPARMSEFADGVLYRLSFNKYYVDEAYAAVIVRPYLVLTRAVSWFDLHVIDAVVNLAAALVVAGSWLSRQFDNYVVDGLVNLAANATLAIGGRLRRLQTGSINGYLYGILAAVTLILLIRAISKA
jgi:NADH-quinone oxidoreductase subunit L